MLLQVEASFVRKTIRNYRDWVGPFVDWLEEQAKSRTVVVTSRTIKTYLKQCDRYKTPDSYYRAGTQIVDFVNHFVNEKVHLIRDQISVHKYENVNLPKEHVAPIDSWLRSRLLMIFAHADTKELKREVSKILGK